MAQAAIAGEVHQPLDVHRRVAAQVALDRVVGVERFANLQDFGVRKILDAAAVVDAQLVGDVDGGLAADAVDVGERDDHALVGGRAEEHTYELQSLMRISYAVFCLTKKNEDSNI